MADLLAHHPIDEHQQSNALPNSQNYQVSGSILTQAL
jgi:hypothetical protein